MTIQWLGAPRTLGQTGCRVPPCPPGNRRVFDTGCPAGQIRCEPSAIEFCPPGEASYGNASCVPITCPAGTVRDLSTFECVPPLVRPPIVPLQPITPPISASRPQPAPGECLDTQEVVAAQPCFYLVGFGEDPSGWSYQGPPELIAGTNPSDIAKFCIDTGYTDLLADTGRGYFVLDLCDPDTLPAPPSCITPEQRRVLTSCAERGFKSGDPAANWFCWLGLKAPALLREWVDTPDCAEGEAPVTQPPESPIAPGTCRPGFAFDAATNQCIAIQVAPPPAPTAKRSVAAPLLIGAAIVAGVAFLMST